MAPTPCCSAPTPIPRSPKPATMVTRCWSTSSGSLTIKSSGHPPLPALSCSPPVAAISTCTSARTFPSAISATPILLLPCTCRRHLLSCSSPPRPPSHWLPPRRQRRPDAQDLPCLQPSLPGPPVLVHLSANGGFHVESLAGNRQRKRSGPQHRRSRARIGRSSGRHGSRSSPPR